VTVRECALNPTTGLCYGHSAPPPTGVEGLRRRRTADCFPLGISASRDQTRVTPVGQHIAISIVSSFARPVPKVIFGVMTPVKRIVQGHLVPIIMAALLDFQRRLNRRSSGAVSTGEFLHWQCAAIPWI